MQVSWIDPDEIAKLAAQLEAPPHASEPAPWDGTPPPGFADLLGPAPAPPPAGSGDLADAMSAPAPERLEGQGAAAAPALAEIREKLRAIRSRAHQSGILPPSQPARPAAAPAPPPPRPVPAPPRPPTSFLNLEGSLRDRLERFAQWARAQAMCQEVLLADDHGDLLWGPAKHASLALSAILAASAGLRSSPAALTQAPVFIRTRIDPARELSVLPCPTRHGLVVLALLNAAGLTGESAACLREALRLSIDPAPR